MKITSMSYHEFLDEKTRLMAQEQTILDVGGGERFQKWLAPYKALFEGCDYTTLDYDPASGADIVGDIHAIPLENESVDGIICHSVLEHVRDPLRAMEEMRRILKPGGKLFFYVPSTYPYHAREGHYPDYWRFFSDTIEVLFEGFEKVEVVKRGGYFNALSFFIPFQHKLRRVLDPCAAFLDSAFETERRNTTAGFYAWAVK